MADVLGAISDELSGKKKIIPIAPPAPPKSDVAPGTSGPVMSEVAPGTNMSSTGPIAKPPTQNGPPPINVPAVGQQTQRDQAELNRLQTTGSGVDQYRQMHPIAGGILKGLSIVGSVLLPGLAARIPGTDLHHDVMEKQAQGNVMQDVVANEKQAQANESQARADEIANPPQKEPTNAFELWHKQNPEGTYQDWLKLQQKPESPISNPQEGYARAIADAIQNGRDPNSDPHVMAWRAAVDQLRPDKEPNRDDKAIAIMSKPENTWTPEEAAYMKGYHQYVKENKVDPRVLGYAAMNAGKVYEVADPNHPGQTMLIMGSEVQRSAGKPDAAPIAGKGSASVTVPKKESEYMTSGKGGQQLTAFNTAIVHLNTLDRLAGELGNSNMQVFNRAAQAWAEQTGQPAPANFAAAKNAMAGEVAAALKASGATDQEIQHVGETFNNAQSPAQLKGAINTYRELLGGKRDQLKAQHEAAQSGKPNFGDNQQVIEYERGKDGKLHPKAKAK